MTCVNVLSVASEIYPLVKTGGLADVIGALPPALAREGIATRTLVPGYPAVLAALRGVDRPCVHDLYGGPARILAAHGRRSRSLRARCAPPLSGGQAIPIGGPTARTGPTMPSVSPRWPSRRAASAAEPSRLRPDIVHAHDWQAGLVPALLLYRGTHGRERS